MSLTRHFIRICACIGLLLSAAACGVTEISAIHPCTLQGTLDSSEALPGAEVVVVGRPYTAPYDTVVQVGTHIAEVTDVTRTDCEICDACRSSASCTACETCAECSTSCTTCEESILFTVPDAPPGALPITIRNAYGMTTDLELEVLSFDTGEE